jgi:serine kinase of HPr protein (carbohydrate metabolism regulator)
VNVLHQASCVAIGNRAVLIEGEPGSGKSTLALGLIDRGAVLIGDDGVSLEARGGRLYASPAPAIAGLLEVRNLGLLQFPALSQVPVGLVLRLDPVAPRFVDLAEKVDILRALVPMLRIAPHSAPIKAELALKRYGV